MPSIRIPFPFRRQRGADEPELVLASSGEPGAAPPPPFTYDDPRLRAFLSVTFDVLYDWDITTGAISFSDRIDHMCGLPSGAFPRHLEGWLERIHADDHQMVGAGLWDSVHGRQPFRCEYRLRHEDGGYRTVEDQGVLLTGPDGEPLNMIGAMRDVTAERQAQQAAREASDLQRILFDLPGPGMLVADDGRYVDADDYALAFFERTRDEMLSATVDDDFPEEVVSLLQAVPPNGGHAVVGCSVRGTAKALHLSIIPSDLGGERRFVLFGVDISEQRAMQEELARSERALRRQATVLDERNAALRVLLEQREQDRRELEQRIVQNVERLIEPTLDRLSRALRHQPERYELDALRANLREIVGPFAQRIGGGNGLPPLTRREAEIANLVRLGNSSAEIAEALHISASSVAFHRANIRRKLGLPKRGPRLGTHLAAMGRD